MDEKRGDQRYETQAKVKIDGIENTDIQLKDISVAGCQVLCPGGAEIVLDKKYKMQITPETEAEIGLFDLVVESKWVRTGDYFSEIGFFIIESPKGKQFQHYVDYLSWRSQ